MRCKFYLAFCLIALNIAMTMAQNNMMEDGTDLPYYNIPDAPSDYMAGSMIARMMDGLGFRYRWATEGLTESDLAYEPGNDGQSMHATLDHLLGLSEMIYNTAAQQANIRPKVEREWSWEDTRKMTLENIEKAARLFESKLAYQVEQHTIKFKRGDKESEVPLWHLLNGPLADALYHTGQVVSFRRTNGNPMPPGVNVFMGTKQ